MCRVASSTADVYKKVPIMWSFRDCVLRKGKGEVQITKERFEYQ